MLYLQDYFFSHCEDMFTFRLFNKGYAAQHVDEDAVKKNVDSQVNRLTKKVFWESIP